MTALLKLPITFHNEKEHRRKIAEFANKLSEGKLDCTGSFTLTANVATTTVTDARLGQDSVICFQPTTANASTQLSSGAMYESSRDVLNKTFTITHTNNAQTDRTFRYAIFGG